MQKLFNKILIPVDFSSNSDAAVEKAIGVARHYNCSIHLLHVVTITPFALLSITERHTTIPRNKKELEFQLGKLNERVCFLSGNSINVEHSIISGTWNQAIIDFVNTNNIDLVIIGQKKKIYVKRKMLLNPDYIAEKADVPVITIPSNRRLTRLYSIVIPITDFLPVRKLMYGVYMAFGFDGTIRLLGIENVKTKDQVQYYLEKASQLIRDNCNVNVETETVLSQNIAEAVNEFAMIKSADLIIVNPGLQSKMPGLLSTLLGNVIQRYSAPPVLTVNPS